MYDNDKPADKPLTLRQRLVKDCFDAEENLFRAVQDSPTVRDNTPVKLDSRNLTAWKKRIAADSEGKMKYYENDDRLGYTDDDDDDDDDE